jgi:DNA/RNA non-specific endonuclease
MTSVNGASASSSTSSAHRSHASSSTDRANASPSGASHANGPSGREIVESNTYGRGCQVDMEAVAADLKREIAQRPQDATKLTMQALEHVRADDRDELAQEFVRQFSDDELKALGQTEAGRGALALAVNELAQGSVYRSEAKDARRVGAALGVELDIRANAGWSWERISGAVHTALDIAGFIPGLGAIPDLINAGLYAAEGDWKNAALSSTAALPLVGDGIKGGVMVAKAGREVLQHGDEALGAVAASAKAGDDAAAAAAKQGDNVASVKLNSRDEFRAASKNPQPNTTYTFDGFTYKTDELGRGVSSSGQLKLDGGGNRFHDDYKIGHQGVDGDIAFHAGADRFGFQGGRLNLSPGNRSLNGNEYARFEDKLNGLLKEGKRVDAEFRSVFNPGNTTARPDKYEVIYRVDGGPPRVKTFLNQPGG